MGSIFRGNFGNKEAVIDFDNFISNQSDVEEVLRVPFIEPKKRLTDAETRR